VEYHSFFWHAGGFSCLTFGEYQTNISAEITSATAVWYQNGMPVVPIHWVLIRDPQGKFEPRALLCIDQNATPVQILNWFVHHWKVEVTFQEVRSHLGVDIVPFRVNSAPMVRKGYRSHYTDFARIIFLDHFASAPISS
jgi:hypothetical protein